MVDLQQLIRRNGQIACTFACRIVYRIGDRCRGEHARHTSRADLSQIRIDMHLGELRAEGVQGKLSRRIAGGTQRLRSEYSA